MDGARSQRGKEMMNESGNGGSCVCTRTCTCVCVGACVAEGSGGYLEQEKRSLLP